MITIPLQEEKRTVTLPNGSRLESLIYHSIGGGTASEYGAIISHPYGPLGGDMHNNIVREVASALAHMGVATLRYNMRGSGQSTGRTSWTADPESDDLAALITWWTSHDIADPWVAPDGTEFARSRPQRILLIGYSFGCLVSIPVARVRTCIAGVILISPPASVSWALTCLNTSKFNAPLPVSLPKLAILGSNDQFSSESSMLRFIAKVFGLNAGVRLNPNLLDNGRETIRDGTMDEVNGKVVIVRDRDHFWIGEEDGVVDIIEYWVHQCFKWNVGKDGPGTSDPNISSRGPLVSATSQNSLS